MEKIIKQNLILIVLGNNQDGCLLTGDNLDVLDFREIHNKDLKSLQDSDKTNFRIKTGMNICTAYLKDNSTLIHLWGKTGSTNNDSLFIKLNFSNTIKKCAIGDSHILFLLNDGDVYVAGEGPHGQLGLKDQNIINLQNPIRLQLNTKIQKIYVGVRTTFFIDEYKNLFCCGSNRNNELGLITDKNKSDLSLLCDINCPIRNENLTYIRSVQCGFKHSIFLTDNDNVYGSGDNSKGVLGFDSKENLESIIKKEITILTNLKEIWKNYFDEEIKKIKCGWNNTIVLTDSGKLYSTGYGRLGQLGYLIDKKVPSVSYKFNQIYFHNNVMVDDVIAGSDFFFAVDKERNLYSWGWNEHFNLGLSHNKNVPEPCIIESEKLVKVKNIPLKVRKLFYLKILD